MSNTPIAAVASDPPVQDAEAFALPGYGRRPYGLLPDGRLWAVRKSSEIILYDGRDWRPLDVDLEPGLGRVLDLLPGAGGVMLATVSPRPDGYQMAPEDIGYGLIVADTISLDQDLQLLIADHADVLSDAFASVGSVFVRSSVGGEPWEPYGLLTDDAGRLWLIRSSGVDVLVDGAWHLALDEEMDAAAVLGVGERLVLVPRSGPPRLARWNAEANAAELTLIGAPDALPSVSGDNLERGPDGEIWLGYVEREKNDAGGRAILTVRIDPGGETDVLHDVGWPRLIEADGTVWLGGFSDFKATEPADRFAVWRDGRIVQHLRIPRAGSSSMLFSVRPGSVWVWNDTGLAHVIADDPDQPGRYRVARTVTPEVDGQPVTPRLRSTPPAVLASPLGFIVTPEQRATSPSASETRLVIVRLFERGGADGDVAD